MQLSSLAGGGEPNCAARAYRPRRSSPETCRPILRPFPRRRPSSAAASAAGASLAPPPPVAERRDLSRELDVAVRAVHMACSLCQVIQQSLLRRGAAHVAAKPDDSPVTVADWGVQAAVSWVLAENFPGERLSITAEEDAAALASPANAAVLDAIVAAVNGSLSAAAGHGLAAPPRGGLRRGDVLEAIARCSAPAAEGGRRWVLDPVDGTLGFVRGDQYAVALALIDGGEAALGVLGCPNYPLRSQWLRHHHRFFRAAARLAPAPPPGSWHSGCVMYALRGGGGAWMQPVGGGAARPVRVSSVDEPAAATFCEPVETANSSHSFSAGLAHHVGLRSRPLRLYSMVKYAAIARGDAEVFMKFARSGYREKVWDHAAGAVIVEEAGGVVTDAGGRRLDFSGGLFLRGLDRGIVACSGGALHRKIIGAVDASWGSSEL
ncbi:HAL2-like protein [Wolffia australiana]